TGLVLLICCLITWVGLHDLNYREFGEVLRLVRSGAVHELLAARLRFWSLAASLGRRDLAAARDAGIARVEVWRGEERILLAGRDPGSGPEWHLRFPLGPDGKIVLCGPAGSLQPLAVAALLEMLRQHYPELRQQYSENKGDERAHSGERTHALEREL